MEHLEQQLQERAQTSLSDRRFRLRGGSRANGG